MGVVAQMMPGGMGRFEGPGGPPQSPPVVLMKASPQGVFVLSGGLLVKYSPTTLQQVGSVEVDKKPGDQPAPPADNQPMLPRPAPPAGMLISGNKVFVVIGDRFVSVNAESLVIAAKSDLPKPPNAPKPAADVPQGPMGPGAGPDQRPMGPIPMEISGNMLYVVRGSQILGIKVEDGSVVQGALPAKAPQTK